MLFLSFDVCNLYKPAMQLHVEWFQTVQYSAIIIANLCDDIIVVKCPDSGRTVPTF